MTAPPPSTGPPPTDLPVEATIPALRTALQESGHAVLQAAPGAGKTTVVPLRLLHEPWLGDQRIVMLEPRRLATRAAATRMASLLGEPVGATIGFVTRDERKVGRHTRIEVVTEGILTRRLQHDASLPGVGLVVFDEVHERNLQTDLALALALDARSGLRPDLRLLAMSATLDVARVAAALGVGGRPAPVIESEGREFPVEVRWAPPPPRSRAAEAMAHAIGRALREAEGDVLAFLPGAADIRRVAQMLGRGDLPPDVDVRPLFGALPVAEQDLALAPSPAGRRRVVLATDIAETSLTVAGVRIVVDGGESRRPRFDTRTGLTRLHTGPIARAAADQRTGRAGRTAPGVAYRLWSKLEQAGRPAFAEPEIALVDLAGFALELAVWGATPEQLTFLDPPPPRALAEGRSLLTDLGALDGDGRPTTVGRAMAELPLHPRLARMVVAARAQGHGWLACVLAALLEERDVLRGRPDDLPVDVAERVRLVADRTATHPAADRGAVAGCRRRAELLARRAGIDEGPIDRAQSGPVLALGYPDRVAQARGGARFRMRSGGAAWLPAGDSLAGEPSLVIVDLDGNRREARARLAAALDAADVEAAVGDRIVTSTVLVWDAGRNDLRAVTSRRVDDLDLGTTSAPAERSDATAAALLAQVRATRMGVLRWTEAARLFQSRVNLLRAADDSWPDLSDGVLLATLDDWLAPHLALATSRADLERIDLLGVLRSRFDYARLRTIERLAPARIEVAPGRSFAVDYSGDQPKISARVQDLFGIVDHPAVADGRVPLLVELLSPARRPVQLTADLPGFWAGSYAEVRKEMAGRYPKHPWPLDPTTAQPPPPPRRR